MTIGVCLIVKNEEKVLSRCLECVKKFADEIVVADTGSSDATVKIAKKFTDKVYFFDWRDDFSAARNFAFSKAESDYVMWLDADDIISDENCRKIKEIMQNPEFDMAFLQYVSDTDGSPFIYYRERILRRSKNYRFSGFLHEAVVPSGVIEYFDIPIIHKKEESDGLRNLKIYQKKISEGVVLDARATFYYGRELLFNNMLTEGCAVLEKFLDGCGWVENKIEACLNLYFAYNALGDKKRAEEAVLKSFLYAPPRSAACCVLGNKFFEEENYDCAIFWYKSALNAESGVKRGGFYNTDYGGFIPCIQLCVIYDRLGEYALAREYNSAAGKLKPTDERYLANERYFTEKFKRCE